MMLIDTTQAAKRMATMIQLRPLVAKDVASIENWPVYPPEFEDLDYALRKNGWLAEFRDRSDTWIYAVEQSDELIAFSILTMTSPSEAEFRIALRSDKIALGLGRIIAVDTLKRGFDEIGLTRIHLIVRKNNQRAFKLYQRMGFSLRGECCKRINNSQADFFSLDIVPHDYLSALVPLSSENHMAPIGDSKPSGKITP